MIPSPPPAPRDRSTFATEAEYQDYLGLRSSVVGAPSALAVVLLSSALSTDVMRAMGIGGGEGVAAVQLAHRAIDLRRALDVLILDCARVSHLHPADIEASHGATVNGGRLPLGAAFAAFIRDYQGDAT